MTPAGTQAIVIGIEKYDTGSTWNLDGPAMDAARFVRWLTTRGVLPENIALFASPLDANRAAMASLDVPVRAADSKTIVDAITGELANRSAEPLLVLWGGHGVMGEGTRRLFFSDARENNLRCMEFEVLTRLLRSTAYAGSATQAVFVDVCANYFELMQSPRELAVIPIDTGMPRPNVSQFALFGAGAGERARNVDAIKSGLFSSILLEELDKEPPATWPPDFEAVRSRVEQRMAALRTEGKAKQTPAYYYYQTPRGEGTFESVSVAAGPRAVRSLSNGDRDRLVATLLRCRVMQTERRRDDVLSDLRRTIADQVERDAAARFDVIAIVKTCERFRGGLAELMNRVGVYESETQAGEELRALAETMSLEEM